MPSESQHLLPFSVTVCDSHLVSRCRQGKADASNDRALVMQMPALCCLWWLVQCGGAGSTVPHRSRNFAFHPHPSSGRETAVGKPGPGPSLGRTIPKPGPILHLRERHSVFPVWRTCLEPSPSRQISSGGLISDLCELQTDNQTVEC